MTEYLFHSGRRSVNDAGRPERGYEPAAPGERAFATAPHDDAFDVAVPVQQQIDRCQYGSQYGGATCIDAKRPHRSATPEFTGFRSHESTDGAGNVEKFRLIF